ncbi:MAG: GAF domain-containing protein [Deltaproteobacteria bacterium]|nr:GAF domain-containing protein [Deltaproteobacteria bacterium]MBW2020415.1 GAF domain-containing protein [Deltaproteobacteria bacterium]MBW2075159.1 GAF domain-containing protein [Deltaproteobacteria bacterium]
MDKRLTYEELEKRGRELKRESVEHKRVDEVLCKRTKELKCLYAVLEIINRPGITLEERLQQVAASLPEGWQYSEIASARVVFEGQTYSSNSFNGGPFKQAAGIIVDGNRVGMIEVYYGEERPESDEGPFLESERELINAIAGRISTFVERRRADEARQIAQKRLQEALTKILSGFLPICAKCKKIRDDASKWVEIETYIRDHTDVEFSHGICPECAKEQYPDFVNIT